MRVPTFAGIVAVTLAPILTNAFVPTSSTASNSLSLRASSSGDDDRSTKPTVCEIPSEFERTQSLVNVPNGANAIRSAVVVNPAGDFVRVDDAMKSRNVDVGAPHVVIFLRHMG
jgi:hypothetical protein